MSTDKVLGRLSGERREKRRFRLTLAEFETGIVLNQAGRYWLKGQPFYEPSFDTEVEALALKVELSELFPWAEVWIRDTLTPGDTGTVYRPSEDATRKVETLKARRDRYWTSIARRFFGPPEAAVAGGTRSSNFVRAE